MINLNKLDYQKSLETFISSNEAYIFDNPYDRSKLIKIIKNFKYDPDFFQMKMYTISLLLKYKDILRQLKITMPEDVVVIEGIECGYQTEKIKGSILEDLLNNPYIPIEIKINYFKQIGAILRNLSEIRKNTYLKKLFYVDIHEGNFIVDRQGIVYGIDPDSFSILDNIPTSGYYSGELYDLCPKSKKYQFRDIVSDSETDVVPDENVDLYAYIRMVLNFMTGTNLEDLTPNKLFNYLTYLESHNCNLDLLYALESIYNDSIPNINPDYLLDYLKEIYKYSNINYDTKGILSRILK